MKQFFLLLLTVVATAGGAMASDGIKDYKVRNWTATETFHSISVIGDVSIVLVEDANNVVSVQGKQKLVDDVAMNIKNGVLIVEGKRGPWRNKTVVYIPVNQLKTLTVRGASEVASMGVLNSAHLHIRVEGSCKVSVKNKGLVTVDNDSAHSFSYEKNERLQIGRLATL